MVGLIFIYLRKGKAIAMALARLSLDDLRANRQTAQWLRENLPCGSTRPMARPS